MMMGNSSGCLWLLKRSEAVGLGSDTWKKGWILIVEGRTSLYAWPDIRLSIMNEPTGLWSNLGEGHVVCTLLRKS
jgi:hypothetical protein